MKKLFFHIVDNILIYLVLLLFAFFFFYRLGFLPLTNWDEAWYATVARNMLKSGDWLDLQWNGRGYYDHPPMGFWLMGVSLLLFGVNEFAVRFPSALLGLLTLLVVYYTGKVLFKNKLAGVVAAVVLGTSAWYVVRVRSGNLDAVFVFFYALTVFLAIKAQQNFKYFPLTMLSFAALVLSKAIAGLSAAILIVFLIFRQILLFKKNYKWLILGVVAFLLFVAPWYILHFRKYPDFYQQHFLDVGVRNKKLASYFHLETYLPLFYLHMGVRKWYYLWFFGLGTIILTFNFLRKNYLLLLLWNFIVLYPFLTTNQTHIWHLIPVYLPLSLLTAGGVYELAILSRKIGKWIIKQIKLFNFFSFFTKKAAISFLYLSSFLIVTIVQVKTLYSEIIPGSRYVPPDVDISKRLANYKKRIYLDDDFYPVARFYSGKEVTTLLSLGHPNKELANFLESGEKNFVVVTRSWELNELQKQGINYKLLEQNETYSIITR